MIEDDEGHLAAISYDSYYTGPEGKTADFTGYHFCLLFCGGTAFEYLCI